MEDPNYDEDLNKNQFLLNVQQCQKSILIKVIENDWIICVPRSDSVKTSPNDTLSEDDVCNHILVPSDDKQSGTLFKTLTGNEVQVLNRSLIIKHGQETWKPVQLLFEETFYTENLQKYRVWCVNDWMTDDSSSQHNEELFLTNFSHSMDQLWARVGDKNVYKDLEKSIKEFEKVHKDLEKKSISEQQILIRNLYTKSLSTLFKKDRRLREMTIKSRNLLRSIRVAFESYILHALRKTLRQSISYQTAHQDAALNKIINNLREVQLRDLGVKEELRPNILRAKLEMGQLDEYLTVMGKIGCLKRVINSISQESLSSDELLPVLVFLIIKSGLRNWTAQVTLLKNFRFSAVSEETSDQIGYLIASLEAAVEHIRSGNLTIDTYYNQEIVSDKTIEKSEFFECIKSGNITKVENTLKENKNISKLKNPTCHPLCLCELCIDTWDTQRTPDSPLLSRNPLGYGPLHIACFGGNDALIQLLLNYGSNVDDVADVDGFTPLHCAALRGHLNAILILVQAGVNCGIVDAQGNTALHVASDRGHESSVKALLHFVPDVNAINIIGDTPLHLASKWGYIGIVQILLSHGANPQLKNRREQTPLAVAHSNHITHLLNNIPELNPSMLLQSMEKDSVIKTHSKEGSPKADRLMAAIVENDICLVSYYLGLDGPLSKSLNEHAEMCHPLCTCQTCSSVQTRQIATKVRKAEITVDSTNDKGETGLHVACAMGCTEIVQLLLDAGANVRLTTNLEGRTALHLACLNDHPLVVEMLMNCGACCADVKDNAGDTPLSLATGASNSRVIEILLRHGVGPFENVKGTEETQSDLQFD